MPELWEDILSAYKEARAQGAFEWGNPLSPQAPQLLQIPPEALLPQLSEEEVSQEFLEGRGHLDAWRSLGRGLLSLTPFAPQPVEVGSRTGAPIISGYGFGLGPEFLSGARATWILHKLAQHNPRAAEALVARQQRAFNAARLPKVLPLSTKLTPDYPGMSLRIEEIERRVSPQLFRDMQLVQKTRPHGRTDLGTLRTYLSGEEHQKMYAKALDVPVVYTPSAPTSGAWFLPRRYGGPRIELEGRTIPKDRPLINIGTRLFHEGEHGLGDAAGRASELFYSPASGTNYLFSQPEEKARQMAQYALTRKLRQPEPVIKPKFIDRIRNLLLLPPSPTAIFKPHLIRRHK